MKIIVNKREKILPENISISDLMNLLGYSDTSGVAMAINNNVIPKAQWENTKLEDGNNVTVIQATCGG